MIECSIRSKDQEFAKDFLENHPEYSDNFNEETIATLASYLVNKTGSYDNFEEYLKKQTEVLLSKEDYERYQAEANGYLEAGGQRVLVYNKNDEVEKFIEETPALFNVFKDNKIGKRYAIFKEPKIDEKQPTSLQEKVVNRLKELANKKAEFVKKGEKKNTNVWAYDGKEIEALSVSNDIENIDQDPDSFPVLQSEIGTLVDHITRDFFNKGSKLYEILHDPKGVSEEKLEELISEKYGKLITPQGVQNLAEDLTQVEELLKEQFGEDCEVISNEVTLFGRNSETQQVITGIPDLLIVDSLGVVHVVDLKTKSHDYGNDVYNDKVKKDSRKHAKQISRYIKMLQALGLKVSDKPMLLLAESYGQYITQGENRENPLYNVEKAEWGEDKTSSITIAETGQTLEDYIKENGNRDQDYLYREPRIHFPKEEKDADTLVPLKMEEKLPNFESVEDQNTNDLLNEQLGTPQPKQYTSPIVKLSDADIFSQPELISATELYTLSKKFAYLISDIIEDIKNNGANGNFNDMADESLLNALRGHSDKEIVDALRIDNIIDYAFEWVTDSYTIEDLREDYDSEEEFLEYWNAKDTPIERKALFIKDHREQFIKLGYSKLLELENFLTLEKFDSKDQDTKQDYGDTAAIEDFMERYLEGSIDKEAWMLGERQFSPKASLSQEIKNLIEKATVIDENGEPIEDSWGLYQHIDSTTAVQSILDWCSACETIEEMMEALNKQANYSNNSWLKSILKKINADKNLQKKFFRHFRKDSLKYSICRLQYKDGKASLRTEIINTRSAYATMMNSLTTAWKNHNVGILVDSRGKVNHIAIQKTLDDIESIQESIKDIFKNLTKTDQHKDENAIGNAFEGANITKKVTEILNNIGVYVTEDVVNDFIIKKLKGSNANNAMRLLTMADSILKAVKNYGDDTNPTVKGNNHSTFPVYKNLLTALADSVQMHVESSVYQDGKTYYSYCNPSNLMHQIRNLTDALGDIDKFNAYIDSHFKVYRGWFTDNNNNYLNSWIDTITDPKSDYGHLDHKVQLMYNGTQYKNLGALGYQLSILTEYFGSKDDPEGTAWFALPTMSNKPTSEFVRFNKFKSRKKIRDKVLFNTLLQETNRIVDVLQNFNMGSTAIDNMDITEKNLKKAGYTNEEIDTLYDHIENGTMTIEDMARLSKINSGAKFHFLYYMNSEFNSSSEVGQLMVDKINTLLKGNSEDTDIASSNDVKFVAVLKDTLESKMKDVVEKELATMEEMGIFETETRRINGKLVTRLKYQERFNGNLGKVNNNTEGLEKAKEQMKEALRDFIWQDIAANINIIQITGGDLAYYGNSINYQKRIAQIHSPGLHLCSEKNDPDGVDDGYLRSVHVADESAVSEVTQNAIAALEEYKKGLHKDQQEDFGKMIKIIAQGFEKIDVTDGQSFACPTSYRKKFTLQGAWTDEMEEAYNRIREGNFNLSDLGVMWGSTKPFVTAQIPKYSGSNTMDFRKKPLQDKNSEYMLLLAEALSYQAGKDSKMTAIYDFMESTHWSEYDYEKHCPKKGATYKKTGIDTVHFASVGKVGLAGVVDFSEKTHGRKLTSREVIDILNEATAFRSEDSYLDDTDSAGLHRKLKNNSTYIDMNYNEAYVDTIPVENYIIQQEVPAHLIGHEQLYGSQSRILGISDITPGTEFEVKGEKLSDKELVDEYKELHAANIRDSFDALMEELGLDKDYADPDHPTVAEKNARREKLESILQKEILKDSKYGYDIARACTLEVVDPTTGEKDFIVPLMDPIQSTRIQMLINSIIKNNINKQKIKGGPVVQSTVYDKDLHIIFKDKNGKPLKTRDEFSGTDEEYKKYVEENQDGIMYFECYMPVPNAELEEMITKPDGSMMTIDEIKKAIGDEAWEAMSQIIGYRIPTEDKYSMIPLKIKGFVPKAAGQVIMMPKEITYLTGSDFDIDKMYLMLKSFKTKKLSNKEIYNMMARDLDLKKNIDIKEYFKDVDVWGILDRLRDGIPISEYEMKKYPDAIKAITDFYKSAQLNSMFAEYKDTNTKSRKANREARNNRILDLQWSVLTNKDTASKMLNPGNFNIQKKTGRIIKVLKAQARDESIVNPVTKKPWTYEELSDLSDKNGINALDSILEEADIHSVTLATTKIYFQQQNMQGTQMVGIFANHNTSHAFVSFQKIGINCIKDKYDNSFYFNGIKIGDPTQMIVLDEMAGFDGKLISKTIAEFLAASVDTAKDPTLKDMNVNTFTGNIAMTLARLGFDTESIGLFLSQPIIQKISDTYFKRSNDGYYDGSTAIKEVWKSFGLDSKSMYNTKVLDANSITKENLIKNIGTSLEYDEDGNLDMGQDAIEFQMKALIMFNSLYKIANDVNDLTFCTKFNSIKTAVGPTIAATAERETRYKQFINKVLTGDTCFYNPKSDSEEYTDAADIVENDPILSAFYNTTTGENGAAHKIFSEHFPHYAKGFQEILDTLLNDYIKADKINEKLYNKLINDYMLYVLTYNNPFEGIAATIPSGKAEMDYYVKGLVGRFNKLVNRKDRKPNMILDQGLASNCLRVRVKDDFIPMDTLVFNSGQLNAEGQEDIKAAWSDLITSEDLETRAFGIDLFYYTLLRNGFGFSPKTLMHLASTIVRQNVQGYRTIKDSVEEITVPYTQYVEGLRNFNSTERLMSQGATNAQDFIRMFIRNHSNDRSLVPMLQEDEHFARDTEDNSISITIDKENEKYMISRLTINKNPLPFIALPINSKTVLYELDTSRYPDGMINKGSSVEFQYKECNKLGLINNFLEYNANSTLETSYFEGARAQSEEENEEESEASELSSDIEELEGVSESNDSEEDMNADDYAKKISKIVRSFNSEASQVFTKFANMLKATSDNEEILNQTDSLLEEMGALEAKSEVHKFLKDNKIC